MTGPEMVARQAPGPVPSRVLLVGGAHFDGVVDSYRRALSPYHEVRHFDPFVPLGGLGSQLSPKLTYRIGGAVVAASRLLTGEPLALAEPRLLRAAKEFAPDLILVTAVESLRPHIVDGLRSGNARCKIIGVFSDHIANFGRGHFMGADYDALFFKDRFIVNRFREKLGWKHAYYLPQACDRTLHRKLALTDADKARYRCDLTLAGNLYMYRAAMLAPLVGRDLKIWGLAPGDWMKLPIAAHCTGTWVAGEEKCKAMLSAKIVLNQNHYAEIDGTNKRTFEMAAIGAFQLTDTPALADVFEPDVEVASFVTQSEMLERIEHWLQRPEERVAMADRARKRAHAQHTYEHRWVAHMATVGLGVAEGFPVQQATNSLWAA